MDTILLTESGVYTWGMHNFDPIRIPINDVESFVSSKSTVYLIKKDGSAYVYYIFADTIEKIQIDHKVKKIAVGDKHVMFLTDDGVYAYGENFLGQLGCTEYVYYKPVKVPIDDVTDIACGKYFTLFVKNGKLYGCGDNSKGQLGVNTLIVPIITELPFYNVEQIACGHDHSIIVTSNGVYGLGTNEHSELGGSDWKSDKRIDIKNVKRVYCNDKSTIFLTSGGVYCCGLNNHDKLYYDIIVLYRLFKLDINNVIDVQMYDRHTIFITIDGVYGMGSNSNNQINQSDEEKFIDPIKIN